MSLPARTDVPAEYRFDLSSIYETDGDWEIAHEELLERVTNLRSLSNAPLSSTEARTRLLETLIDCFRRKQRLELYATLAKNVATETPAAADRERRYRAIAEEFEPAVTAAIRRMADLSPEAVESLPAEYRQYARDLRQQARHVRSEPVEEAAAAFEEPRTAATRLFREVWTGDFEPPTVRRPDGETVEVRYGNLDTELSHHDRDYRRRVYEAFYEEADRFEHTLTRAFAEKLKAGHAEASIRRYDSLRDRAFHHRCYPESGLRASLPGEVHDVMLEAIRDNLDPYHEALELRRRRLDVDTLRPWDLQVSIAEHDPPELEYETAKEHVVEALTPLGEEYVERVRTFFTERRIDVFPTREKRTDIPAYCPSSADDGAYVLANFRNDLRSTFFLCHELGHAMHVEHEREGPIQYATAPRPVEEIPSILHELLLVDHLVDQGGTLADAASNRLLELVSGNFYDAAYSSVFTHELARRVEEGEEITVERTRDLVDSLRDEFFAPVEFATHTGQYLPVSGTRELYSNYQYVLGVAGALTVRTRLRDGELSIGEYREFLRSTGRERAVDLFDSLGCDVRTATPFETAADEFADHLAEFERARG